MVRISDILKKKLGETPPAQETKPEKKEEPTKPAAFPEASSLQVAKTMSQQEPSGTTDEQKPQEMQIAKAMREIQIDSAHSKNIYLTGIQLSRDILSKAREIESLELSQVKDWLSEIVDYLVLKDPQLLSLFYEYTQDNYLYSHMVNVTIMSIEVGLGLGYNKSRLNELGLTAFVHDIGMVKVEDLVRQSRSLSEEEYNRVKEHPIYGVEILSKEKGISESIIEAVKSPHERFNGKGYPSGLKNGEISEYGRIIAVADVYEALTHDRPYRKKYSPHEAVKEMFISGPSDFDPQILKILISKIGIYPINSWVELNTNEIGRVNNTNDDFPLRPVLNIIFDSARRRLDEPRVLNLAKQFNLFIKKPLSDEEVSRLVKENE